MKECSHMQAWASALLDGEMAEGRRRWVEQHLVECPECRGVRDYLLRLKEALRRQKETHVDAPVGLWERVGFKLDYVDRVVAPKVYPWLRWSVASALGVAVVAVALVGSGTFRRGAVLSPAALADEFPKQGGLISLPASVGTTEEVGTQISRMVGFEVSPPDLSGCGFRLVGANPTRVCGVKGISFVYRRGNEVVVVSQLLEVPRLQGFVRTTGPGEQQLNQATVRDLKVMVWQEGDKVFGLVCGQQVSVGPLGQH